LQPRGSRSLRHCQTRVGWWQGMTPAAGTDNSPPPNPEGEIFDSDLTPL
jgi:hypothetical protein